MNKRNIFIAILAGGKGERLWPKSRVRLPKQNLRLLGKKTILEDTVKRAKKITQGNIFIIAGRAVSPYAKKQFKALGIRRVIAEPFGRNTAPAVGLAALLAFREKEDSILIAMPSDSLIGEEKKFFNAMKSAINAAGKQEGIVTLGIRPTSAKSSYGYIGINERPSEILARKAYKVTKFIEKPDLERARRLVSDGRYFWNSGIFVFRTSVMLKMLKKHTPALYKGLTALPDIRKRHRFDMKLKKLYKKLKAESLDYAVLEKSENVQVVPSHFKWSDLGSFESIAALAKKDEDGNVIFGNYAGIDTKRSLVFSDANRLVGTLGINNLVIVATSEVVLVCDRNRSEEIKKLVEKIKNKKNLVRFL